MGEKLRTLRSAKGISSTQLEHLSGISQSNISKIERECYISNYRNKDF
ncbi:helix-turn-helix domain-containing protein [[Brevibacterium] frigoritolerans]|uniref:Helix-turn-helix domain-containing protein n=1 Tax=Peribacillus frigoritolerans TaxID=450367 RepID=A0A941FS90_9BACI|nr:helix-turn-helix domain-containing protein [Peribacillus frigoritolerans]